MLLPLTMIRNFPDRNSFQEISPLNLLCQHRRPIHNLRTEVGNMRFHLLRFIQPSTGAKSTMWICLQETGPFKLEFSAICPGWEDQRRTRSFVSASHRASPATQVKGIILNAAALETFSIACQPFF
jgi:hypothetical protein